MAGNVGVYLTEGMILFSLNDLRLDDDSSIPTCSVSTSGFVSLEDRETVQNVLNEDSLGVCGVVTVTINQYLTDSGRPDTFAEAACNTHCGEVCDQVDFKKHVIANQHYRRKVQYSTM